MAEADGWLQTMDGWGRWVAGDDGWLEPMDGWSQWMAGADGRLWTVDGWGRWMAGDDGWLGERWMGGADGWLGAMDGCRRWMAGADGWLGIMDGWGRWMAEADGWLGPMDGHRAQSQAQATGTGTCHQPTTSDHRPTDRPTHRVATCYLLIDNQHADGALIIHTMDKCFRRGVLAQQCSVRLRKSRTLRVRECFSFWKRKVENPPVSSTVDLAHS